MHKLFLTAALVTGVAVPVCAQMARTSSTQAPSNLLTVDRIFVTGEFRSKGVPQPHWLANGTSYLDLRRIDGGVEIVRVDAVSGQVKVLAPASIVRTPTGAAIPIEDMVLSNDEQKALLFHNSERVWRQNTKGQYTVIDFAAKRAIPIAPNLGPKMFAKFSPDGKSVAYVRDHNLYLFDLATGKERALTTDGNANIINGTSDWVYEEEFDLRDAFRWSPDGKHIAFWRFDQSAIPTMTLINQTDSLYPQVFQYKYPKAGQPNSVVHIGVVDVTTGATTWMKTGDDPSLYLPRMGWIGNDSLWVERMPRRQNRADMLMVSIATGGTRNIMSDSDSAYVSVFDPIWINNNKQFLWSSDRSGWRQIYLYNRNGSLANQVTKDGADVLSVAGVDTVHKYVYVAEAAPTPMEKQIYRYGFDGKSGERVTRDNGSYEFNLAPGGKYVSTIWSNITTPPSAAVYELPSMHLVRGLANNTALKQKVDALGTKVQFFKIPSADPKVMLDAYRILPPGFDSTKKYPIMMYTYGGPAIPQVLDTWMGSRYLFHSMLAQLGYVVVVADNRGAAWRGRDFRKMTQGHLGIIESDDQIAVAKWLGSQTWGDASRIGLWGWSYGGYNTAMSVFRGGSVFKIGISVAPVTDWRFYDSIYTERFMWTPQDNTKGYNTSSTFNYVNGLTAKYLLIYGTGDDNVHPQNSVMLTQRLEYARKPFSVMLFPNKTHALAGQGGTLPLFDKLERFIRTNL
jgi:dipeptidyl-peptidase-4